MTTRKIKDAKDLSTNELIYFKGHAQATYMSDGRTVEEAITTSSGGSSSGSGGNVKAIVREGYSELETNRPIRDAKDLTTGELVYFTGHASHIVTPNGGVLMDYIDDGDAQGRIYRWNVEAISNIIEFLPGEVTNIIYGEQGLLILNGGVANLGIEDGVEIIYSSVVKDESISITKVYLLDIANYQGVVIDEYDLNGSGSSSGSANKQLSTSTSSSMTLSPNVYYRNTSTSLSTLTITFGSVTNSNIMNEYFVEFTTRSSGTTVSFPSSVKWADGVTPTWEAGCTYQVSIINSLGVVTKFK